MSEEPDPEEVTASLVEMRVLYDDPEIADLIASLPAEWRDRGRELIGAGVDFTMAAIFEADPLLGTLVEQTLLQKREATGG